MEFDHLGAHCAACRQRAFAPVRCACALSFCAACSAPSAHGCSASLRPPSELGDAAAAADATAASRARDAPCAAPSCGIIASAVRCALCGRGTCVPHRQPRDHACARGDGGGATLAAIGGGAVSASARLAQRASAGSTPEAAAPPRARGPLSAKDAALAARVALMRLKARVPPEEVRRVPESGRLFLEARAVVVGGGRAVGGEDPPAAPSAPVSVCVDALGGSTVGSLLDALARRLGVANANDRTPDDAARLHLYAAPPLWAPPAAGGLAGAPGAAAAAAGAVSGGPSGAPPPPPTLLLLAPFSAPLAALVRDGALCSGSTVLLVAGLLPPER
jgi:hypothetical protein